MDAAYAIAQDIHSKRLQRGEQPVGRKIGFTNRRTWLGHQTPFWSYVYDSTVHYAAGGDAHLRIGHLVQPRIEPEILLHFAGEPPVTSDEEAILASIDWIAQAFEVVQSPYPDWSCGTADAIVAFGLHGALVVGTPVPVSEIEDCAARLRTFSVELLCNGEQRSVGGGAEVLDSPLLAFAHINQVLSDRGERPVQADEIVSTGTLTGVPPATAGETWTTSLEGIDLPGLSVTLA